MPTYEFKCKSCQRTHEVTRPIDSDDNGNPWCCGLPMQQVFSAPGIIFKGSGWASKDK